MKKLINRRKPRAAKWWRLVNNHNFLRTPEEQERAVPATLPQIPAMPILFNAQCVSALEPPVFKTAVRTTSLPAREEMQTCVLHGIYNLTSWVLMNDADLRMEKLLIRPDAPLSDPHPIYAGYHPSSELATLPSTRQLHWRGIPHGTTPSQPMY